MKVLNFGISKGIIFDLLDNIEIKTKIMCHNDPHISQQDGKLPDSYFKEFLNKYIDELNKGELK